ncbi:MAG TPA: universal stress protein [Mucilaginibacter sp.]|jgi:nucleotide-binding universal stress UspA family protein
MKTILVLTDFSAKAENAAMCALKIAEKAHANIVLFHSVESFQPVNVPESGSWVYEDYEIIKTESLAELKKLEECMAAHHQPGAFEPEISLLNEMGYDLGSYVNQLVKDKNIDLIVMGTKGDNTVSHLFNGSDTDDILEHAPCPVLFVPETGSFDYLKTIIFADDLKKDYTKAIGFLIDFARIYYSHIILTHFGEYDNNALKCLNFIKNTLKYTNVTSRLFPLENIGKQLRKFVTFAEADLVVLIHHKDDRFENFIYGSESKNMLKHNNVPLLVLPG